LCPNDHPLQVFRYAGGRLSKEKKKFYKPILDKIKGKLNAWKDRYLILVGRICLVSCIFIALPLYYFSFFRSLINVCQKITKVQRSFLWDWKSNTSKIAWVNWTKIYKLKEERGEGA